MASLSTPTLLATFQTAHASSSKQRHVALSPVHGSDGELAVAAVQGDGVWTYDLRTLRPTTSYSVPPQTAFSTHPLSYLPPAIPALQKGKAKASPQEVEDAEMSSSVDSEETVEAGPKRTTMVGVRSPGTGEKSGEIWCWRGEDDEKSVIQALHHLPSSRFPVLGVSNNGNLFLLDSSDRLVSLERADLGCDVVSSRVVSTAGDVSGLVLVGDNGQIRSVRIHHPEDGESSARVTSGGSIGANTEIAVADVAVDGMVPAFDTSNKLLSTTVRRSAEFAASDPIPFNGLLPALAVVPSARSLILHAVSTPTSTLLLTLPGPDGPIVLASSDISAFSTDGTVSQIALLGKSPSSASSWTAAFVVWHKHAEGDSGRSVVYTCELTLPAKGFGMNLLLGSQERTATYMVAPGPIRYKGKGGKPPASAKTEASDIKAIFETKALNKTQWGSLRQRLRDSKTMSSSTIVSILQRAIVDRKLEVVYTDLLSLAPPAIDFRFELRRQLSAEEATQILKLLVRWSEQCCARRTEGLGWPDSILPPSTAATLPSLDSVIAHSSLLLDSHLPLLVEYDPAGPLLESLSASLAPLLALQAEIRQLRAPVDALLTLAKREERKRAEAKAKKDVLRLMPVEAYTGSKKAFHPGAPRGGRGMRLQGVEYGKWQVEDFEF